MHILQYIHNRQYFV